MGTTLLSGLGRTLRDTRTGEKGIRERISGWLSRYNIFEYAEKYVFDSETSAVGNDTTIAMDITDISKEFGGNVVDGMTMGLGGCRDVMAMGHDVVSAAAVDNRRQRAIPIAARLNKGRKGSWRMLRDICDDIDSVTDGRGVFAVGCGGDGGSFAKIAVEAVRAYWKGCGIEVMFQDIKESYGLASPSAYVTKTS